MARRVPICLLLVAVAMCRGADAWQHPSRRHVVAQPRLLRPMPTFRSIAHRPLLRQPRDPTTSTPPPPPPTPATSSCATQTDDYETDDYEQHLLPCSEHSDCDAGGGYCRQAVGGPRCSPCVDYRMHSCDEWGDSIDGDCEVCHMRDTKADFSDLSEHQLDANQEAYEEQAVSEAIAAPIYGRYGELRSEPSPPTQSGAGRKDVIHHQQQHRSDGNVLAKLKAPTNTDTQTASSSYRALSSEPEPEEQRSPARTQRWFTSTISEHHWPSDGSSPPVSSTLQRTLEPSLASGATVEREVLHRAVGDKEVRDTLTVRHEQDGDDGRVSARATAVAYENGKMDRPQRQRQVKNIKTEEELAAFERHFSGPSMALRRDQLHQPHLLQDKEPHQAPVQKRCQHRRQQSKREMQSQLLHGGESYDALLRLLGQVFRSPVSADGEYDGTNDAMAILHAIAAGL